MSAVATQLTGSLGTGVSARRLWTLLIVAVAVRILWSLVVPVMPVSDSHAYDTLARNLAFNGVFGWTAEQPFSFWPPGTSMLYAVIYRAVGIRHEAIVGLNLLLAAGMIVLAMRVAFRLHGERCAYFTGWVLALWPTLVMFTTILASELPFLVLSTAALDVWTSPGPRPWARGVIAGILLGGTALVRPVAMALPVIFAVGSLLQREWSTRRAREQVVVMVASLVAMACVIGPWTLRNYELWHELVLVSSNGGVTLWMGNAPGTGGEYMEVPAWTDQLTDGERNKVLGDLARQYILDDPVGFLRRSLYKLRRLYDHESIGVVWNEDGIAARFGDKSLLPLKLLTHLSWAVILVAAANGLYLLIKRLGWRATLLDPVVLTIAFYSLVHSIVVSQDRYHLEFAVQLAVLGGAGFGARGGFGVLGTGRTTSS